MNDDIAKYAQQLRRLVDEHYHQQIAADEYRAQRKLIFDAIEMQLAGDTSRSDIQVAVSQDEPTFLA